MTEAVLGVFAHPDDEALLAGGTLAACAAAGLDVTVVCVTAGELGGDPDTRRAELAASGEALGIARAECLGYPDGELESADEAFGTPAESIAISIDVRPFLERKLRALRSHASQFGPAHVVSQLPDDLAAELLGKEYLVKLL